MTWQLLERVVTWPWRVVRWFLLTRPIRFTRFGLWYIFFTIAVGAAAINTGNNLLYLVLGILLGSIVVSGILSDSSLWHLNSRWIPLGSLYAGRRHLVEAEFEKGRFPGVGITIQSTWSNAQKVTQSHFLYWLASGTSEKLQMDITPRRRGWVSIKNVRYSTRIPFGLFEKFHTEERDERWIVFPAVEHLSISSLLGSGAGQTPQPTERMGTGAVPFDLRQFRSGDSARRIHWRSSAKRQRLLVHEMEEESDGGSWLMVSAWPQGVSEEQTDAFITFVASAIFTLIERGRPVGLITPDVRIPPANSRPHLHRLLRYLALVVPSSESMAPGHGLRNTDHYIDMPLAWRKRTL